MGWGRVAFISLCAFVLGVAATPLARRLALRLGVIDRPDPRKPHLAPVPLLGGVAIYAAVVITLLLHHERKEIVEAAGLFIGATWVWLWGMVDDVRPLPVPARLATQGMSALVLLASGIQVRLPVPDQVNVCLTLLWVVGVTNAFNLLDNVDGLCGGVGAVVAASFLLLAALNGQYLVGTLAAALLGACLGFLLYNFHPARIFMGDAGSLFIGFLAAAVGIKLRFPANVPWVTWMVPILVVGLPIFDTTLVIVSRLRQGRNPLTTPGTDHLSHRLIRLGWSGRETVMILYLVSCATTGVAVFVSVATPPAAYAVAGSTALIAATALMWLEFFAGSVDRPFPAVQTSGRDRRQV